MTDDEVRAVVTERRHAHGNPTSTRRTDWTVTAPSHWHTDPPVPRWLAAYVDQVLADAAHEAAANAARLRRDATILPLMQPDAPAWVATVRRAHRLLSGWKAA